MNPKVVGLVGSPRKGMNTDTLVTKVLEGADSIGAETEKIYLNDLEIRPCQACDEFPAPGFCLYKDGMETIYKALQSADALVIGTPSYYESMSAQLKLVIDRSNCLAELVTLPDGGIQFKSRLSRRKKGIFIWVADLSRNPEHALATMRAWCLGANVELVDTLIVTNSEHGQGARNRKELLHRAFELGISLAQ